jgi:programmed cell death 8 (apoptosis-inducing factor)
MDKSSAHPDIDANSSTLEQRLRDIYDEWRRQLSNALGESNEQVSLIRASKVKIDVEERVITLSDRKIQYDKCLLATGGKPREFYVLDRDKIAHSTANENINTLHTLVDFKNLATIATPAPDARRKHVTVVGGGYLGTEVAAALAETGACKVTHVLGERTPLAQYLPLYLSEHVIKQLVSIGVDVRGEALVTGLKPGFSSATSPEDQQQIISTPSATSTGSPIVKRSRTKSRSGPEEGLTLNLVGANQVNLETDYLVLASTNVQPDLMGLDDPAVGLEVSDGGIVVNASLEAYDGLFVAGNAATYFDTSIGRRRVDTYDHAVASGMWAGHNMMASERLEQYTHQPCFKSTLAGTGLSFLGVGKIDASLETVGVWFRPGYEGTCLPSQAELSAASSSPPLLPSSKEATKSEVELPTAPQAFKRGVVYYIERGRVVGVLLCNAGEMLDRARDVLRAKKVVTDPVNQLPKFILLAPSHWLHVISTK